MERAPENQPPEDYSHFTDEDWALHEGLWGFAPEDFPQRELSASGDFEVVYYDSSYRPVRIVPITPDGRIDTSREAAQQPGSEALSPNSDSAEAPVHQAPDESQTPPAPDA